VYYIMYKNSVPTSQKTNCVLLKSHRLILFREVTLFTVKLIQTIVLCDKVHAFLLQGVVHIFTTVL